jgi:hypothetical protein
VGRGPGGATLAEAVAGHLAATAAGCPAREAVDSATALVRTLLTDAGAEPGAGSAVSFCVLHLSRREIWRVGEGRVLLDGTPVPPRPSGERAVAEARALVLRRHLADGVPEATLLAEDPGRAAVQELLRALVGLGGHFAEVLNGSFRTFTGRRQKSRPTLGGQSA